MLYFKSLSGKVFAYDTQDEREQFGPPDLVPMTEAEVQAHLNPAPAQVPVAQRIADLERQSGMVKAVRKFMLTAMEAEAIKQGAAQGLTSVQALALLRSKNAGYAGVKALDEQIEALEALL